MASSGPTGQRVIGSDGVNGHALPETSTLPSANCFAECQISGTRRRASLPSAALGKEKHMANSSFAECSTLGKTFFAECFSLASAGHSAKDDTRQRT
jgi:hypothetical protein